MNDALLIRLAFSGFFALFAVLAGTASLLCLLHRKPTSFFLIGVFAASACATASIVAFLHGVPVDNGLVGYNGLLGYIGLVGYGLLFLAVLLYIVRELKPRTP